LSGATNTEIVGRTKRL